MKKEFKAPIVETKELSAQNSIMDGGMVISGTPIRKGKAITDNNEVAGYEAWKGTGLN